MNSKRLQNRTGSQEKENGPKLADIARHADVSTATVSRFLNDPGSVRAERAGRVRRAVEALGYVPNGAARALASQRSKTVGAVIPTLDNAIFARGIESFQRALQEFGYTLLLASNNYDLDQEVRQIQALIEKRVDGILLVGRAHRPQVFQRLNKLGIPYLSSWTHDTDESRPTIGFDNREAMRRLTSYLIDIGHRRIGVLAGHTADNDRARERVAGIKDALTAQGLVADPNCYRECDYRFGDGRQGMRMLMSLKPRPTAVVCGNDVIAAGALLESRSLGLTVPAQVSIIGFDDLPLAKHLHPSLTTARVPAGEMGRRAALHLLARISGKPTAMNEKLDVEIIIRDTTAPPPAEAGDRMAEIG